MCSAVPPGYEANPHRISEVSKQDGGPCHQWPLENHEQARSLDSLDPAEEPSSFEDGDTAQFEEATAEADTEQRVFQWPDYLAAGDGAGDFLLVDGELHLANRLGLWSAQSPEVVGGYLRFRLGASQDRKTVLDAGAQLSTLSQVRPEWLQSVSHSAMNHVPLILQSSTNVVFSLATDDVLNREAVRHTLTLNNSVPVAEYNPELLANPPQGVQEALCHYGVGLLARVAWLMLGPKKVIDVVNLPLSNSGKSTLAEWMHRAFPSGVEILDAVKELKNGNDFSPLRVALSERMLTFVDESDKIETPPSVAVVIELTANVISVNLKGVQSRSKARRGNVEMLGAGCPNLISGQRSDTRFQWAWARETPSLRQELRDLLFEPDAIAWLSTWMCEQASCMYRTGNDGTTDETRAWAAEFLAESADPLPLIMADLLKPDPSGFVSNTELLAAAEGHPERDRVELGRNPTMTRAWGDAMKSVGGRRGRRDRKSDRGGRGWKGVSLTEAAPTLEFVDFADAVDASVTYPRRMEDDKREEYKTDAPRQGG